VHWFRRSGLACTRPWRLTPYAPGSLCSFSGFPCRPAGGHDLGNIWVALLAEAADLASLDGQAFAAGLAGELRAGLVLMQGCPSARRTASVTGEPAALPIRFTSRLPGISEDSGHRLSQCPGVAPWWCAQRQRRQCWRWQASSRGAGMLCERLSSSMIVTGRAIIWVVPDNWHCAAGARPMAALLPGAEAIFTGRFPWRVCTLVVGSWPNRSALAPEFRRPRPFDALSAAVTRPAKDQAVESAASTPSRPAARAGSFCSRPARWCRTWWSRPGSVRCPGDRVALFCSMVGQPSSPRHGSLDAAQQVTETFLLQWGRPDTLALPACRGGHTRPLALHH